MSKLEQLIQELCPNGVEYKRLGEIVEYQRGKSITKKNVIEGDIPVISGGQQPAYYHNESNREGKTITIAGSGAYAGYIMYWEKPIFVSDAFSLKGNEININTKYIYYYLKKIQEKIYSLRKGAGISHVYFKDMQDFLVPVPPLEVQCEIVRILDKFTLLTAELTAELTARRKQYEYYRNLLVSFNNFIQKRKFGNIASIQRGASPRPISQFITNDMDGVNWIKIGDVDKESKYITKSKEKITIDGSKKSRKVKKGDFILSNSMSFGRPYILAIDGCIHDGWLSISDFEDVFISDFLYYLLNSNDIQNEFRKKASFGGAVQNLNADIVKGIELNIPSKDEQQKIINILDKFDKLCNDITNGLPAEIDRRQKQYEYYRDKLLTFKEKK